MASKRAAVGTKKAVSSAPQELKKKPMLPTVSKCGCKGNCGSRRCGCVKRGSACGDSCKCTGCKNPFKILQEYGIDCAAAARDKCLMDNIFKFKTEADLRAHLEKTVMFYCCETSAQVKDMIPGLVECPAPGCLVASRYSWCRDQPFQQMCRGMEHCEKCRACVDEGDRHCDDCNTCYFSGWSCFQCPCKGPDETGLYPDHIGPFHPLEGMLIAGEMMAELLGDDHAVEGRNWLEEDSLSSDDDSDSSDDDCHSLNVARVLCDEDSTDSSDDDSDSTDHDSDSTDHDSDSTEDSDRQIHQMMTTISQMMTAVRKMKTATRQVRQMKTATRRMKTATRQVHQMKTATRQVRQMKTATRQVRQMKTATRQVRQMKTAARRVRQMKTATRRIKTATPQIRQMKTSIRHVYSYSSDEDSD
ncbi:uncharacterized protein LOC144922333 [Branchiostoma floridae x Branchiostoma belcheri]